MKRDINIPIYLGAFIISVAIFIVGVYVGSLIDSSNLRDISDDVSSISEKVASVQLLLLTESNSSAFCSVYASQLDSIDSEVELIGHKLTYLEEQRHIFDSELKKKYFILEAESYLLSKKVRDRCGDNSILLIHFYSNKNCTRCIEQGTEVLKARDFVKHMGNVDVKLFSFDGDLGSPVVDAFKLEFNITKYPTIVLNDLKVENYTDSSTLSGLILNISDSSTNKSYRTNSSGK